jgi:hypothetical protein
MRNTIVKFNGDGNALALLQGNEIIPRDQIEATQDKLLALVAERPNDIQINKQVKMMRGFKPMQALDNESWESMFTELIAKRYSPRVVEVAGRQLALTEKWKPSIADVAQACDDVIAEIRTRIKNSIRHYQIEDMREVERDKRQKELDAFKQKYPELEQAFRTSFRMMDRQLFLRAVKEDDVEVLRALAQWQDPGGHLMSVLDVPDMVVRDIKWEREEAEKARVYAKFGLKPRAHSSAKQGWEAAIDEIVRDTAVDDGVE